MNRTCGAITSNGKPCKRRPTDGRERCNLHGGKTPRGIASPQFKDGRYSKAMPERLLERFEAAKKDPELLNLSAEIALVESRLEDLLRRVEHGESISLWKELEDTLMEYQLSENDGVRIFAMSKMEKLIKRGLADFYTWHDIGNLIEQRRKLVDTERKHMIQSQMMLTLEQGMTLVTALLTSVKANVTDPIALRAISRDVERYLVIPAHNSISAGDEESS